MRGGPPEHRKNQRSREQPYEHVDLEAPLPIGADGGLDAAAAMPQPLPLAATEAEHVCLRGPCRHFWSLKTSFEAGNPAGTFESLGLDEPRKIYQICLVNPGYETELTGDCVFACSRWEPRGPLERSRARARQLAYHVARPIQLAKRLRDRVAAIAAEEE